MSETLIKRHPAGLFILFFTEMWERFSYYGMRAILVYYMTKQLLFAQDKASSIYGTYTALVYLTPLLGGYIADRYLGQRKSVIVGGLFMALGQFMLISESLFFPALGMLIIGNGFFKPNISTQVGGLYQAGDNKRDEAFSIFYVGINLGAFFSPLVCGTLGELYGWKYGFMAAGFGMLSGLALYIWGQKYLAPDNIMQKKSNSSLENKKDDALTSSEWGRIGALIVLCMFNVIFWATYEQQGNTLALWADANTNRHIFGPDSFEIPASWFQSLNPLMIFIFTPIITSLWAWQAKKGKPPSSVGKMAIGCILLGLSFIPMIYGAKAYEADGMASMWWLIICTLILTIGELYLSPVGLSLVTKIAPLRMVSVIMGMWFLSSFFGNYLSGYIGTFWEKMSKESFFMLLSGLSIAAGLGIWACKTPLKKAMSEAGTKVDI